MIRKIVSMSLVLMMVLALTGCDRTIAVPTTLPTTVSTTSPEETAEPTVEETKQIDAKDLVSKAQYALKTYPRQYTESSRIELRTTTPGMSIRSGISYQAQISLSSLPFGVYQRIESIQLVGDMEIPQTTNLYYTSEDGEAVEYLHVEDMDLWMRIPLEDKPSTVLGLLQIRVCPGISASGEMYVDSELENIDGREAYVLHHKLEGDDAALALYSIMEYIFPDVSPWDLDLSMMEITAAYYFDAETYIPLRVAYEYEGLNELIETIIAEAFAGTDEAVPTIEVIECTVVQGSFVFEPVEVPAVPEGAKEKSKETSGEWVVSGGYAL